MEVKPGYKQTEVGVIPEDWELKRLSEISPKQSVGLVINPSTYFDKAGTVPLLVGSNIGENKIDWASAKRITEASNQKLPASKLCAGDLVMVRVGDPGTTAVIPPEFDGCNCASMMIVRKHPTFQSEWLCFAMNSPLGRTQVALVQYGTAQKQFNISDAVDFRYPVPPLPEQRVIAEALSDVVGLLDGLDRLIAKKRDLKQAAMQQLLTGQTRLPGFHGEWEVKTLGEVAQLNRLNVIPASQPTQMFVHFSLPAFDAGKAPVVELGSAIGSNKFRVQEGAVLLSKLNPRIPRVWAPDDIPAEAIASTEFLVLTPREGTSRSFLFVLCSSPLFCTQMELAATGTTGSHQRISPGGALALKVSTPVDVEEQTAIAAALADMDAELVALGQRREKTRALKQAMMQELLTGRTRLV